MTLATLIQKFKSGPADIAALVADLESQLADNEIEATAARDAHVEALLLAPNPTTDANVSATRVAVAAVAQRTCDITSALLGARARQAAIAASEAATADAAREAERQTMATRVAELAGQREQAAHGIVVALNKYAAERTRFIEQSAEIRTLAREFGVDLEPRGAGLDAAVVDGFINHELGALQLPHGAAWHDPHLSRPSLTKFVAASAAMIRAAVGRG